MKTYTAPLHVSRRGDRKAKRSEKNMAQIVQCKCGEWSGERCTWSGPRSATVVVEYMPEHLRASHVAARNRGIFPHNGAGRIRVAESCAAAMIELDGEWCCEV